jgi:hypothetical protein
VSIEARAEDAWLAAELARKAYGGDIDSDARLKIEISS